MRRELATHLMEDKAHDTGRKDGVSPVHVPLQPELFCVIELGRVHALVEVIESGEVSGGGVDDGADGRVVGRGHQVHAGLRVRVVPVKATRGEGERRRRRRGRGRGRGMW